MGRKKSKKKVESKADVDPDSSDHKYSPADENSGKSTVENVVTALTHQSDLESEKNQVVDHPQTSSWTAEFDEEESMNTKLVQFKMRESLVDPPFTEVHLENKKADELAPAISNKQDSKLVDEEMGLIHTASTQPEPSKSFRPNQMFCCRWPILVSLSLVFLSLAVARGVGKSSNSSVSSGSVEEENSPVKLASDERVKNLISLLSSKTGPVIISTVGSNGVGMSVIRDVLRTLGMAIPETSYPSMELKTKEGKIYRAGFKRVLDSALTPDRRINFDERSVADFSSLTEWHLGRAFVAGFLNKTIHEIPKDHQSLPWAFAHPRAGYLLPYFKAIFGTENFRFVHVVSNPFDVVSSPYEEFTQICKLVRYGQFCNPTPENKLLFWGQVNQDAFKWAKEKLDVDRYVIIRAEDFIGGEKSCIKRAAMALGLNPDDNQLGKAVLEGLNGKLSVAANEETVNELVQLTETLPAVMTELSFFGYEHKVDERKECDKMSWF